MSQEAPAVEFPLPVIIDTREQRGFTFEGLVCGQTSRPLVIRTARLGLDAGDYSLAGWQDKIAVERKSLADFFSTLSTNRARFRRELERLSAMSLAAVVVEAEWSEMFTLPPRHSKLHPRVLVHSVVAWQQQFPKVHWWMSPGRRFAEIVTFRLLERFYHNVNVK